MDPAPAPLRPTPAGLLWQAGDLQPADWQLALPAAVKAEFTALWQREPTTAAAFRPDPLRLPAMTAFGRRLRDALLRGRGLCCLRGLDEVAPDPEALRTLYVAIGCALGDPMLQYGRLYPVVDRGASYTEQTVPVSMTNAETSLHTDSSAVGVVPDFVGLLCEQPSPNGGDSLVSNALHVHEQLRAEEPAVLALLERPWIRDIVTPGIERTPENLQRNRFPVFAPCDRPAGVVFRYMRYWLEVGQRKAGAPLDAAALEAFDRLDELLAQPENVVRFRLERGCALWVNNRTLAHNRTAYVDAPDHQRVLQRMWIDASASRGIARRLAADQAEADA